MPIYDVRAPDGKIYEVQGPENASNEQLIATLRSYLEKNKPEQAGFIESALESAGTLTAAPAAARFGAVSSSPTATPEEKAAARRELLAQAESKYAKTSFEDVKDIPSAIDWVKQLAGGSLGYLAAPAAAATAASAATTPVGGLIAGASTLGTQYTTSNLIRQAQEQEAALARGEAPEETSVGKAVVAAAGSTALDYAGFRLFRPLFSKFPLLRNLAVGDEKAAAETTEKIVEAYRKGQYSVKGGIFKGAVAGTAFEVPQEVAQSALERWQAGQPLADENARKEYLEAAVGAAVLGAPMGGASQGVQNVIRSRQAEETIAAEEDRKRVERKAAEDALKAEEEIKKEEKRKEKAAKSEDIRLQEEEQLNRATEIVRKVGTEDKENTLRDELRSQLGIERDEAIKLLGRLKSAGVVSRADNKTGLITVLEPKVEVPGFAGQLATATRVEAAPAPPAPVVAEESEIPFEASAPETVAPEIAAPEIAAAPVVSALPQTEATTDVTTETGAEGPVTGASAGSAESAVSRPSAEGPGVAGPDVSGVGSVVADAVSPDAGEVASGTALGSTQPTVSENLAPKPKPRKKRQVKPVVDPALDTLADPDTSVPLAKLTPEVWREKLARSKQQGVTTLNGILDRINNLKATLPAQEEVMAFSNAIESVAKGLRDGVVSPTALAARIGANRELAEEIINDLVDSGAVSVTPRGLELVNEGKLNNYVYKESSFLQQVSKELTRLIGIYDKPNLRNTAAIRESIDKNLTKIEETIRARVEAAENRKSTNERERAEIARRLAEQDTTPSAEETLVTSEGYEDLTENFQSLAEEGDMGGILDLLSDNASAIIAADADAASGVKKAARTAAPTTPREDIKVVRESIDPATEQNPEIFARLNKAKKIVEYDPKTRTVYVTKEGQLEPDRANNSLRSQLEKNLRETQPIRVPTEVLNKAAFVRYLTRILKQLSPSNVKLVVEGREGVDPEIFERLKNQRKFAEYDPQTATIYVRRKGLTPSVLLHEFAHAATVEVLRKYETDPNSLTETQRNAVKHLQEVYELAKKRKGGLPQFREGFENLYEFASYGLTDPDFQRMLSELRVPRAMTKYSTRWLTEPIQNLWRKFTTAVIDMFGLDPDRVLSLAGLGEDAVNDQLPPEDRAGLFNTYGAQTVATAQRLETMRRRPEGNLLLEVVGAMQDILKAPVEVADVAPLPARERTRVRVPADPDRTAEQIHQDSLDAERKRVKYRAALKGKQEFMWGRPLYEKLVRLWQNTRRPLLNLQEALRKSGKLVVGEEGFTNLYDLIMLSAGKAYHNFMTPRENSETSLKQNMDVINNAVGRFAKATNLTAEEAMNRLSNLMIARHEPERRFVKFLLNAPLNSTQRVDIKDAAGNVIMTDTPANVRDRILKELYRNTDKTADGKALLSESGAVKNMRDILESLVGYQNGTKVGPGYIDVVNGTRTNDTKPTTDSANLNSVEYNVIGVLSPKNIQTLQDEYNDLTQPGTETAKAISDLTDAMRQYQETAKQLDREANYWSVPVDNIVKLYDFKNYVPLKGFGGTEVSKGDERFEIGKRLGGEYVESQAAFEGRETYADNVLSQTMIDGIRSAMRAGRKDITQAIVNLSPEKAGVINAKKVMTIPFADRYKGIADLQKEKGPQKLFHYLPDGTIEVWEIKDKEILESVRRSYEQSNPYIEMANALTSGIGRMHTRWNPAFYPYNFVRDVLTNAFTLGTEMGPSKGFRYISGVAANVAKLKFGQSHRISRLYAEGNVAEIRRLAQKDPFAKSVLEYLQAGGRVTYIQGLAMEGQLESLQRQVGQNKLAPRAEIVTKWVDAWADMFEFMARVSAFDIAKQDALSRGVSEAGARTQAAAYAKNLANFEQVGKYGKEAGALFMFFRPAATGAVRAFDTLMPMLENVEAAVERLPEALRNDPEALQNFRREHAKQKQAAARALYGLMGAGALLYTMALMASDDDPAGRNRVQMDDMDLWTRNLRLPTDLVGDKGYIQIPWGFGLGAFLAAGAQVAGAASGPTSVSDMASNIFTIMLDSYIPVPVSRINPMENPSAWLIDSLAPSPLRPLVEFQMNIDGLGREIYNNRLTKYGDAYTFKRNTPLIYQDAADVLFKASNGEIKVSPDSLYFFANNYFDGFMRIAQNAYGMQYTLAGTKAFDAKTDISLVSSFIGRYSNYDARQFAKMEEQFNKHRESIRALKEQAKTSGDVSDLMRYYERYPNIELLLKAHDTWSNRALRDLRAYRNGVRSDRSKTPKEKELITKEIDLLQDAVKRRMLEVYKQYDLKP